LLLAGISGAKKQPLFAAVAPLLTRLPLIASSQQSGHFCWRLDRYSAAANATARFIVINLPKRVQFLAIVRLHGFS